MSLSQDLNENSQDGENLWSVEIVDELINLVRKNVVIYDQCNPDHSNRDLIDQVWRRIGTKLNRTAEACSKKWQALRAGYRKRKNSYVPSGSSAKKIKKWAYFDNLSFLQSYTNDRKTITNLKIPDIDITSQASSSLTEPNQCSSQQSYYEEDGCIIHVENAVIESEDIALRNENDQEIILELPQLEQEIEEQETSTKTPRRRSSSKSIKKSGESSSIDDEFRQYLKTITEKNKTPKISKSSMELFLLSLLEDASSLSNQGQREFKIKTLELLDKLHAPEKDV